MLNGKSMTMTVGMSIVGTGKIVQEALPVLRHVEDLRLVALCARPQSKEKAMRLAQEHSVPKVETDYEEALHDDSDILYIALPNTLHYAFARKALLAGKSVIIEKPIVTNPDELSDLTALAQERGLYIFENMTVWHNPLYERLRSEVLPQLGNVRLIQCNYSQRSSRYDRYMRGDVAPAFDPSLFGGALWDLNVYNFAFVISLFGQPRHVTYNANWGFNGVDTSGTASLSYADKQAIAVAAKDSDSPSEAIIQGDGGWLRVDSAVNELRGFSYSIGQGPVRQVVGTKGISRLLPAFRRIVQTYAKGDYQAMQYYLELSHKVIRTMSQLKCFNPKSA